MVFEGYKKSFRVIWCTSMLFLLISGGHTFYLQACYSTAAKTLAKCQPWQASEHTEPSLCAVYRDFSYTDERITGIRAVWSALESKCKDKFSVLNPAFVDAVVIALPATVLVLTFLLMHFFAGKPIKKLPELGAFAVLLMIVSSGCGCKALGVSNSITSSGSTKSEYVRLSNIAISFIVFQCLTSGASAVLVILLWSGKAFTEGQTFQPVRTAEPLNDADQGRGGSRQGDSGGEPMRTAPESEGGTDQPEREDRPEQSINNADETDHGNVVNSTAETECGNDNEEDDELGVNEVSETTPIMQ